MQYPSFSEKDLVHFHNIRTVSPQSIMYGVSFRLPSEVAFGTLKEEPLEKKRDSGEIYDELEDKSTKKKQKTD